MSILHGTLKGGVCKLCLTEIFWILKHFNNKHLLNKKSQSISKCRHGNKLLVKSAEKGQFYLYLYCCIILVFITKYFVFRLQKTKKKISEDCEKVWNHIEPPPLENTTPSFLLSPSLNRQTFQAPPFQAIPPTLYWFFMSAPLKVRFFSEPPKY